MNIETLRKIPGLDRFDAEAQFEMLESWNNFLKYSEQHAADEFDGWQIAEVGCFFAGWMEGYAKGRGIPRPTDLDAP